jgi:cell division protein FtsB
MLNASPVLVPLQARQGLAEQHKLVAEKNALIETVKRLNREVAKLEHFKRNLLQQLQDDEEVG